MNKKIYILTILMLVMAINTVFSQTTTKKLSYQAVVRNAANELVVNQTLSVEITILNANNVPQYKETHTTVPTNQNGLLWLWVGDGTPTLGTMDAVVWKDATIRSVFTLPDGSTVTQNTPVNAMPYAYYADEVDTMFLQDYLNAHDYGNDDYVTHQELDDTLNHYYTNTEVDAALVPYATTSHLNDTLDHYLMHEVQALSISHDTIFLTGGTFVKLPAGFSGSYHDLVDTPTNVSAFTNDAGYISSFTETDPIFNAWNKSYHDLIDTPTNVSAFTNDAGYLTEHQSLEGYVTTTQMNNQHYLTSDSMVITTMQTNITNLQNGIKKNALCDSVNDCVTTIAKSVANDTANSVRAAIHDSLSSYKIKNCDDVTTCVNTALADGNSATNHAIDSIARHNIHDTAQAIRSLIPIVPTNVSAFTNDAGYLTEHQSLEGYVTTTQMNNQHYLTSDSTVITTMQTNITNLQNGIKKNALCDSVNDCVTAIAKSVANDTASALRTAIHDSIGDATLTIAVTGGATTTFTANSKTNQSITLAKVSETGSYNDLEDTPTIPTTVAQLTDANNYLTAETDPTVSNSAVTIRMNGETIGTFTLNQSSSGGIEVDLGSVAIQTENNTFTGANNFTEGSITVPSRFDIQNPPTATTCTQDAVNVCDLLAVLESLNNKIQALEDALEDAQEEIEEMKNTMPTLTVTADNPDINITAEENVPITYTASVLRSSADFSYRWYVNGVLQEGVTGNSLPYTHNASGSYKVECIATAPGPIELKGSLKKTICIANRPLALEYSFISGDSADFGKIRILGSTASSAIWYNEDNKEVGRWNSGLTDVLPRGVYTVALSSSACERKDTITIALIASPLCLAGHLFEDYEDGVTILGRKYVTRVKDIDNNWYNVVEIGIGNYVNCWTRENMRATRYINNNDTLNITNGTELEESVSVSEPYFFNLTGINPNLGYLYNWPAASGKDVANAIQLTPTIPEVFVQRDGICHLFGML